MSVWSGISTSSTRLSLNRCVGTLSKKKYFLLVACCAALLFWNGQSTYRVLYMDAPDPVNYLHIAFDAGNMTNRTTIFRTYMSSLEKQPSQIEIVRNGELPSDYEYDKRRTYVKEFCDTTVRYMVSLEQLRDQVSVVVNPNIVYCSIPMTGIDFWRRVLITVKRRKPDLKSPFLVGNAEFKHPHFALNKTYLKPNHLKDLQTFLSSSVKFLFTRNPYRRAFLTYVEGVFAPNPNFWENVAKPAVSKVRMNHNANDSSCGMDLTFPEFVHYLVKIEFRYSHRHLLPASKVCDVCKVQYDVLGKMENFVQDTYYILNRTGVLGRSVEFADLDIEYRADYIMDLVYRGFSSKQSTKARRGWIECLSEYTGYRRIWRQLQILGFINKGYEFPLTRGESVNLKVVGFLNMALEAFRLSSAGKQTDEAYLQAYREVPMEHLEKLRDKYQSDFYVFGYNDRPDELFERTDDQQSDFPYFDLLGEK